MKKLVPILTTVLVTVLFTVSAIAADDVDPKKVAQWQLDSSAVEFPNCKLGKGVPMYNPEVDGVAYYEFEVVTKDGTSNGYIIVSATRETAPVAEYSDTLPHFRRFAEQLGHEDFTMVYYGLVYVTAEDENGQLLDEIGEMPPVLVTDLDTYDGPRSLMVDTKIAESDKAELGEYPLEYYWPGDYQEFKSLYRRPVRSIESVEEQWQRVGVHAKAYTYIYVSGTKCYWGQIQSATCYTGCGPTAWANLYGWWEKAKGKSSLFSGSPDVCTINSAVSSVIWSLVGYVGTYCIGNDGATNPWNIYKGYKHANAVGYGYYYKWHWRIAGTSYTEEANILRDAAGARRLSIVGYYDDWHYGAGYYYKLGSTNNDVQVKVITGWGCNDTKWVYASDTLAVVDMEVR